MKSSDVSDGRKLSLEDWLAAIASPNKHPDIVDYHFPSDSQRDEYLKTIGTRTDQQVRWLLRKILIPSTAFGLDQLHLEWKLRQPKSDDKLRELDRRRIMWAYTGGKVLPWEGITWILDLLPHHPRKALDVLDSYFLAHCQALPDGRLYGLSEAQSIIRAKYILQGDTENIEAIFNSLTWRELEILAAKLYQEMDYEVELTPPTGDGGSDVIVTRTTQGQRERSLIQCKLYTNPIELETIRALFGVVTHAKANKGILITTSKFRSGVIAFAKENNIELIDRKSLAELLNEYFGTSWPLRISNLLNPIALKRKTNTSP